ncbi:DUF3365 domain-containing protein [Bizionia sediminis]|uniref:DUF3365 domain-containing protein n=1 Tax=Bizionia sediminis TaxID=1737064 RepID=A0ABW5KPW1_9FLAO
MMRKMLFAVGLLFGLVACKNNKQAPADYIAVEAAESTTEETHPGKKLMEVNCYVCHSPTTSQENRIAPPMIAVKQHYLTEGISKAAFTKNIKSFLANPTQATAKMPGAVKRFGLMPKAHYPDETVAQIADYMYNYDIVQPEWFEEHVKEHKGKGRGKMMGKGKQNRRAQQAFTTDTVKTYAETGLEYALSTKAELGKNLMGTIQKKGTLAAVEFCNVAAYPITDSMAVVHNALIKRVSDKPRNPKNQANEQELNYIAQFKETVAAQQEPKPIVDEMDDTVQVFYPIVTNSMCLQCHGKNVEPAVYKTIKALYPMDEAIGYMENEVRGIWRVSFKK